MTPRQRLFQRVLVVTAASAAVWTSTTVPISWGFPVLLAAASFAWHLVMQHWKAPGDATSPTVLVLLMIFTRHYFYGEPGETFAGMIHVATVGGLAVLAGQWLAERLRPSESQAAAQDKA